MNEDICIELLLREAIRIKDAENADEVERGFREAAHVLRNMVTDAYDRLARIRLGEISEETHDAHVQALGGT